MSTKLIRHLLGALVAVMFIATSAGACAPAPAPAKVPAKVVAMTYVGKSHQKGYDDDYRINVDFCLKAYLPGRTFKLNVRKGAHLHARGEGDVSFENLFTGVTGSYVLRWWISVDQTYRMIPAAGERCPDPNALIVR